MTNLQGFSAAELAIGARGFGPYLKNREAVERRFAHCRALEQLISGGSVEQPRAEAEGPTPTEMLFEGDFGALSFELVEAIEGHRFHDQEHAVRIYGMMPADRETEAAMFAIAAPNRFPGTGRRPSAGSGR